MTIENVERVEQLIALCPVGEDYLIRPKTSENLGDQYRRIRQAFHMASHDSHEYVFHLVREKGLITAELLDGEADKDEMAMLVVSIEHHTGHTVKLADFALPAIVVYTSDLPDQESCLMLPEDLAEALQPTHP